MKKLQSKNLKFLLLVAAMFVVGTGVAFAALSATLTMTFGSVSQNAISWDVAFEGTSATAEVDGTSDTGRSCGTASITPTSVTVASTTLSKPGDKCTYELSVRNNGSILAELSSITPTAPSATSCDVLSGPNMVCGNITYKLSDSSDGSTSLATNTTLSPSDSQTIYLVISYNADFVHSSVITQTGAAFSLVYAQA